MPELPEVEFARRCLERWAGGRTIVATSVTHPRVLRPANAAVLRSLRRMTFTAFERAGKNLMITLRRGDRRIGLWSHLGMTGKWLRRRAGEEAPPHRRLTLTVDDDHDLHYCDLRMFGFLRLVPGARFDDVPELAALGPDALRDGVAAGPLHARLQAMRAPVKLALMDQRLIAGLGNIQTNEALFRARVDPRRPARSLSVAEVRALASGITASLRQTLAGMERESGDVTYVEEPGSPNPFRVYGREGERCSRCRRAAIQRVVQGGRSSFLCPRCQR